MKTDDCSFYHNNENSSCLRPVADGGLCPTHWATHWERRHQDMVLCTPSDDLAEKFDLLQREECS